MGGNSTIHRAHAGVSTGLPGFFVPAAALRILWLAAVLGLLAAAGSSSAPTARRTSWVSIHLSAAQKAELKNGDIIFRKAQGTVSDYILSVDPRPAYSHSGLIRKEADQITVINASLDQTEHDPQVHAEDLDSFLARVPQAGVYRLRRDPDGAAHQALQFAAGLLGTPFDFQLDKDSAQALYCTELVWLAYHQAGIDLLNGQFTQLDLPFLGPGLYILPSDIAASPWLYPVMTLSSP